MRGRRGSFIMCAQIHLLTISTRRADGWINSRRFARWQPEGVFSSAQSAVVDFGTSVRGRLFPSAFGLGFDVSSTQQLRRRIERREWRGGKMVGGATGVTNSLQKA